LSPRAACRLRTLGFGQVHDYVAGKADWLAHGLHTEGENAGALRVKDVVRDDVATCRLTDSVAAVRQKVESSPYRFALVTSDSGVVLGRLRSAVLEGAGDATAEDVMEAGPSTVRADSDLKELVERLRGRDLTLAVVTTPEGKLLGIARCVDAERRLEQG
jgi:CBS domain-containing protein